MKTKRRTSLLTATNVAFFNNRAVKSKPQIAQYDALALDLESSAGMKLSHSGKQSQTKERKNGMPYRSWPFLSLATTSVIAAPTIPPEMNNPKT